MKKRDEIWMGAYGVAMVITALGAALRPDADPWADPKELDRRARELADRATETIVERMGKEGKD
jgi:hypothetical protein